MAIRSTRGHAALAMALFVSSMVLLGWVGAGTNDPEPADARVAGDPIGAESLREGIPDDPPATAPRSTSPAGETAQPHDPPVVVVDPSSLSTTAAAGEQTVERFTLTNLTDLPVDFGLQARPTMTPDCTPRLVYVSSFESNVISRIDLVTGERETLLPSTFRPNNNLALSRDGRRLYYTMSITAGAIRVLDLVSGQSRRLGGFDLEPVGPVGLALNFAESTLFFSEDQAGQVQALDLTTEQPTVLATDLPGAQGLALNAAGTRLLVARNGALSEIDLTSGAVRAVNATGVGHLFDVVLSHDERTAYVADNTFDRIRAVDVTTGVVRTLATVVKPDGLAIDPFDTTLYSGSTFDSAMFALDLVTNQVTEFLQGETTGITLATPRGCRAEYLSFAPETGSLAPFGSSAADARFDSLDLLDGTYEAEVDVEDMPGSALLTFPATFTVLGTPDIALSAQTLDFGPLFIGQSESRALIVENRGTKVLDVTLTLVPGAFAVSPTALSVEPEASAAATVTFAPDAEAAFDATISVSSTDPDTPSLDVALTGSGLSRPQLVVSPSSFDAAVAQGGEQTQLLTISNPGGQPLEYTVVPSPQRVAPGQSTHCEPERLLWVAPSTTVRVIAFDLASGATEILADDLGDAFDLAINAAQTRAYVSIFGAGQVRVLDLVDGSLGTVNGETSFPLGLDSSADETRLYAAEFFDRSLAVVDLASGATEHLVGNLIRPTGVARSPDGQSVFVADMALDTVVRFDLTTGTSTVVSIGPANPDLGFVVTPDGSTAYVSHGQIRAGALSRVNLTTGDVQPVVTGLFWPRGLAIAGETAWVATIGEVLQIDLTTGDVATLADGTGVLHGMDLICATFVAATPAAGVVPPGGSVELDVVVRATGLETGSYGAVLTVKSNDPLATEVAVPVSLEVLPPNRAPVARCRDVVVPADAGCRAEADVEDGSFDPDGDPLSIDQSPAGPYGLGATAVTLTATDDAGASSSCRATVTVVDQTPPILAVTVSPDTLWPPNHRLIDVEATVVAGDNCGTPTVALHTLTSDEPDDGEGDGNTTDDVQGADVGSADIGFRLRAERAANGDGRSYRVVYTAVDGAGNAVTSDAFVFVPHDQGGIADPLELFVEASNEGTRVRWSPVVAAREYDVVRGRLAEIRDAGGAIDLGAVLCIEGGSTDESTAGHEDAALPPPGEVFVYLVQYRDPAPSSYGTVSADKPRRVGAGDCR